MQFVVDAGVKPQFFHHILAFVRPAGNAHRAAAARFGQRAKGTAHRATGRADGHGFTRFGCANLHQAVPGRYTGHADCAQIGAQGDVRRIHFFQGAWLASIDHAVLLPAAHADDLVTDFVSFILRFHHFTNRAAAHGLAQGLRRGVAFGVVHAAAHVGVKAEEVMAHQNLAGCQRRRLRKHQFEVAGRCLASGAVVKVDLFVLGHGILRCVV